MKTSDEDSLLSPEDRETDLSVPWRWREAPPANKSRSLSATTQTVTESRGAGATRAPLNILSPSLSSSDGFLCVVS